MESIGSLIGYLIMGFFIIVFTGVIIFIISTLIRGLFRWIRNNNQPVQAVNAMIISRRSIKQYTFVAFEGENGDRMEFRMSMYNSGLLVVGDRGVLTFQGTRFKGFQRK
ncbi:hypothetical protein J2Z48_002131 [Croceifilum oryzae]|uniref:DUF2500 domain-containing protein n=1 Tax=Croceifilum oryzae TaxID=1553429 RepID=A0AAJ1TK13_9BACL|nr:DUF2500 domain-containing protein [Croceifilum oryzae]MDQ0417947.1 hypothetical protein [Croceifilum oryzae]